MRSRLLSILIVLTISVACGSEKRASPTIEQSGSIDGVSVDIRYGAPSVRNRKIFGELVPFNKIWRTGANESTTISFSSDVLVNEQSLPAGTYSLFTTPSQDNWKVHFNSETDAWGAFSYDNQNDVLVVELKPSSRSELQEQMEFSLISTAVVLSWEYTEIRIPIKSAP